MRDRKPSKTPNSDRAVVLCILVLYVVVLTFFIGLAGYVGFVHFDNQVNGAIFFSLAGFLLWSLSLWCYIVTWLTDPGGVPQYWDELIKQEEYPTSREVRQWAPGVSQYCPQCQTHRPERSHHCSTCDRCVLRMDHHCPLVGNCLGLRNFKAFLLLGFWTAATLFYMAGVLATVLLPKVMQHIQRVDRLPREASLLGVPLLHILICGLISAVMDFFIGVICFCSFLNAVSQVATNCTTIERLYPGQNPYSLSVGENIHLVMGNLSWRWLFPVAQYPLPLLYGLFYPIATERGGRAYEKLLFFSSEGRRPRFKSTQHGDDIEDLQLLKVDKELCCVRDALAHWHRQMHETDPFLGKKNSIH